MNRSYIFNFVAQLPRRLLPLGVLFCLSCGESPGPAPAGSFSEAPADYSTPPEKIAAVLTLPDIDLNKRLEQAGPLDFGERVYGAGTLVKFTGCVVRREGEMHYPPPRHHQTRRRRTGAYPEQREFEMDKV